jgi:hypothetical protein
MDPVAEWDQVRAAWWQEKQDEVMYGSCLHLKTKVELVQGSGQVIERGKTE